MYRVIEIILKTDADPETIRQKAEAIGEVTTFRTGPKIFERTIDGQVYSRIEDEEVQGNESV